MMDNHFHNIPTVLEGESLYEAYCRLLKKVENIETETAAGKVTKTGDTMTGELVMDGASAGISFEGAANNKGIEGSVDQSTGEGSLKITGVKTPTATSDAANKGYVDGIEDDLQEQIDALEDEIDTKIGSEGGVISQGKLEMTGALSGIKFNTASSNGIEGHISQETGVGTTKITGIRNPVDAYDAATKEYVDAQVGSGKVSKTGDSMTGQLTMTGPQSGIQFFSGTSQGIQGAVSSQTGAGLTKISGVRTPVDDYDAATKKYVDDNIAGGAGKVSKAGDNVWGTITFQENPESEENNPMIKFTATSNGIEGYASPQTGAGLTKITNIRNPINDYDVATKKYVDEHSVSGNYVLKEGDDMTGTLNMTEHDIDGVANLSANKVFTGEVSTGAIKTESIELPDDSESNAITINSNIEIPSDNYIRIHDRLHVAGQGNGLLFTSAGGVIEGFETPVGTGTLTVSGVRTPQNDYDAATKKYVDDNLETKVDYADGLEYDLNSNNHRITSLGTPTFNYDAANKKYVDDNAPFNITFNFAQGRVTTTTEYSDLVNAINNGRIINATYRSATAGRSWSVLQYTYADTGVDFIFNNTAPTDSSITALSLQFIHYNADGTITKFSKQLNLI